MPVHKMQLIDSDTLLGYLYVQYSFICTALY